MPEPSWCQKLAESIAMHTDEQTTLDIMTGCKSLDDMDEVEKAQWMVLLMKRMDNYIHDEETKLQILAQCSCRCYEQSLYQLRTVYEQSKDIDKLIDAMHGAVFLNKPERYGNRILITKAPRFPEEHARARTPEEKRYYFCHCDNVRAITNGISLTYCYCGAGWCKNIWESILQRPVRVEITQSVLQGDETCQFAVYV